MTNETIKVPIRKSVEGRAFGTARNDIALKERLFERRFLGVRSAEGARAENSSE